MFHAFKLQSLWEKLQALKAISSILSSLFSCLASLKLSRLNVTLLKSKQSSLAYKQYADLSWSNTRRAHQPLCNPSRWSWVQLELQKRGWRSWQPRKREVRKVSFDRHPFGKHIVVVVVASWLVGLSKKDGNRVELEPAKTVYWQRITEVRKQCWQAGGYEARSLYDKDRHSAILLSR